MKYAFLIFCMLHILQSGLFSVFMAIGQQTYFSGCIGVLMFGRVLLSRVVLQVIVHLAITSLLHLHCFVFGSGD